jgi:hypothetical protein
MPLGAVGLITSVGVALGVLIWRLTAMDTDPKGYTRIASLDSLEVRDAQRILERAQISALTDDHTFITRDGGRGGFIHLLVPSVRAEEAIRLLKGERDSWIRDAPPA